MNRSASAPDPVAYVATLCGLALAAACLTACPAPLARTEATSAPVAGTLVGSDGLPMGEIGIVVALEGYPRECRGVAVSTQTARDGSFSLPETQKRYEVTWIIPNLDRSPSQYALCAAVADTLLPGYVGFGSLSDHAMPDTVACVAWDWEGKPRVSCNGRDEEAVVSGGRWSDEIPGGVSGFYRLFRTEEQVDGDGNPDRRARPHVYVQWVGQRSAGAEGGAAGAQYRVRAVVRLPFDRERVWSIKEMQLWEGHDGWMASLRGYRRALFDDLTPATLIYRLGPPARVVIVSGP